MLTVLTGPAPSRDGAPTAGRPPASINATRSGIVIRTGLPEWRDQFTATIIRISTSSAMITVVVEMVMLLPPVSA